MNNGLSEVGDFHTAQGQKGVDVAWGATDDILAPAAEAIVNDGRYAANLSTTPPGELMPGLEEPVSTEL